MTLPALLDGRLPDPAHEALRVGFHSAIAELTNTSVGMSDFRLALQTLAQLVAQLNGLATSYVNALNSSVADRQALHDSVTAIVQTMSALTLRVVTLEQRPSVRNVALVVPVGLGLLNVGSRDITLLLDRTLPDTNWEPEYWPSPGLLGSATFTTKSKTTNSIVVTVKNTALIAAGGSLGAIAVRTA